MVKIKVMDFATIVSAKKVKDSGLAAGDLVMVVGTTMVPATHKDPYLQRELVRVVRSDGGIPLIPSEKNDYMAYLIDPRSLEKVSDELTEQYSAALKQHYGN